MKQSIIKKHRHGKTYIEAECGDAGPDGGMIDVDVEIDPSSEKAKLTISNDAITWSLIKLELTEEAIDELREVLYEASKQMMVDRNRRVTQEKHARAGCVSRKTAGYNGGEDNGDDPMKPKLYSFKFHRNAYGDVGFNQITAPSLEHAIEFAKDEFEGGTANLKVDVDTFKVVKDVNAYYNSFPLMD